jgi:hypothetical protein
VPAFRPLESAHKTAEAIRKRFRAFVNLLPEIFTEEKDREIRLNDETINECVEQLWELKILDLARLS